ncbi:MAG: hypothetical protein CO189_00505 [candidate division Zixibacteria bacterium CG_4_9_14_3_um_filter_46_8]|nr:MAG: hypothetical protein CO189_00505 [candidate division Zixibacteria bacterium CG_4_9_14_3_um_filter_46_8]
MESISKILSIFLVLTMSSGFKAHGAGGNVLVADSASIEVSPESEPIKYDIDELDFLDKSLISLFKFHQLFIADIDDQTCPMAPTCSNYGIEAVEKYGFFIGALKTIDRLHRCSHDLKYYDIEFYNGNNAYEDYPDTKKHSLGNNTTGSIDIQ